jgi:MSHA biogenesis protein MshE
MEFKKHPSVGEILIQQGVITEGQFKLAESEKKATGRTLAKVLIDLGFIDESRLIKVQSDSLDMPFIDLKGFPVDSNLIKLLPEAQARRYRAIVLEESADALKVGVVDPFDLFSVDEIKRTLGKKVNLALVREADMTAIFDNTYTNDEEISSLAQELSTDLVDTGMNFSLSDSNASAEQSDAPVVRFIDNIFSDAVKNKASDIHIEPEEKQIRIRLRIDGILHERIIKEKRIASAIVMRLKIMCDLDISEKRIPQDGRFQMTLKDRKIDVRLSTMPTPYGESMVMRLLDQTSIDLDIGALNMPPAIDARFRMLISRSHGMFLVTGPTGSGKTTTLYSALNALNKPENKVITAEDPIEYRMERINQVQVNTKVGLTFSAVLRAALRQDPDIILVGEIRDGETAEIALKAAMTGHLVLSTLHTNDAISSAFRLVDMGAKPFVVGSSVLGFMAQRLIKRVCTHCVENQELDHQQKALIRAIADTDADAALQAQYKHGKGCHHCNNTGYKGRLGVYELLQMNEALTTALQKNDADLFTQIARKQDGYEPLSKCALRYAMQGITSLEEVFQLATSDRMLTGIEADEAL